MQKILLKEVSMSDGRDCLQFLIDIVNEEESFVLPAPKDISKDNFGDWLKSKVDMSQGINLPEGYIPCTTYWVMLDGEVIGLANIKHYLNKYLRNKGGHMGLSISKKYRGQGLGVEIAKLLIEKARNEFGIDDVLLTNNPENKASRRLCEKLGAELIDIDAECHYWLKGSKPKKQIKYLTSGPDKITGFSTELIPYLQQDIQGGKLVIIPTNFDAGEDNERYYKVNTDWFKMIGIEFDEVIPIDSRMSKNEAQKNIESADVVFLSGGDTLKQIENIRKYELFEYLQNRSGVTIGVSAGSINMAKDVVLVKDENDGVFEDYYYEGIGLVDINIEPHFSNENVKYNNENLYPASKGKEIICLPNPSAVRVSEFDEIAYIGKCYILKDGVISLIDKSKGITK